MRLPILTAVVLASIPAKAAGTDAVERSLVDVRSARVELAPVASSVGFFDVQSLRAPELDADALVLADAPRLTLSLPSAGALPVSVSNRDALNLRLSPEFALESASLTLRLVPTRRAPNPDVPLVLLPRVAGVGSSWFGVDFAAWF
jgi:hypothetical protein